MVSGVWGLKCGRLDETVAGIKQLILGVCGAMVVREAFGQQSRGLAQVRLQIFIILDAAQQHDEIAGDAINGQPTASAGGVSHGVL
jgi:hypothetical protein